MSTSTERDRRLAKPRMPMAHWFESMREIWITESYVKVDYDGDGIAELRQVTTAGGGEGNYAGLILENEEIDAHPWASVTPIPMPHKFFGMSVADQTRDVQLIKSTLMRQALDNAYLSNAPQIGALEGKVNLDDLLNRRPGGVIRIKDPQALFPIETQNIVPAALEMIAYIDSVREGRTGVQRFTSGPGADALNDAYNKTATGINAVETSSQERLELIARVFGETGVRQAFKRILELVCKHQQKPKMIQLRGKWVEMDPREWNDQMDVTVHVGLGTGNKMQQVAATSQVLAVQQQIAQGQGGMNGPLVTAQNIYNACAKLIEAVGLRTATPFFTDPTQNPMPQQGPPPDPKMLEAQQKPQIEQMKATIDAAADRDAAQISANANIQIAHIRALAQIEAARITAGIDAGAAAYLAQLQQSTDAHAANMDAMAQVHGNLADQHATMHGNMADALAAVHAAKVAAAARPAPGAGA